MSQTQDRPRTLFSNEELAANLSYLNLPFIREHFEDVARRAAQDQSAHLDFLGKLIDGEAAHRRDRAIQRRIQ